MVETTIRDALPADVPFLRDALAKLNDEMEALSGAAGFRAEGFPGLNIEGCLHRDSFLIAVAGEEPRGFLSIYLPYPSPDRALVRPRQLAMINTAYVVPMHRRQGIASLLLARQPRPNAVHGVRPASTLASSRETLRRRLPTGSPDM
jgi:hypothetical protein